MRLAPSTLPFTLLLGVCAGLPALSIDLSAPTLTVLPGALATSVSVAGLSLSLFMVGFATGQLAGGRLSDVVGRRPVLLLSLTAYVLAGVCCAVAPSGPALALFRSIQGVGAGACAVQATAMVQDLFRGEAARRKQSYVSVVLAIMPMIAPAFGTLFIETWGWRSVHLVLAIAGLVLAGVIILFVDESRCGRASRATRGLGFREGGVMLRDSVFRRMALVNALSYGAIFAYIAGAPVVVMDDLRQPPLVYALLFAGTALALTAGAFSSARFGRANLAGERLVGPALIAQAAATLGLVAAGAYLERGGAVLAIVALLVGAFARGLLSPNLVYLAVRRHPENSGLASAIVGLLQLLVGAASSALVAALLSRFGYHGVAVTMALLACAAASVWWVTGAKPVGEAWQAE